VIGCWPIDANPHLFVWVLSFDLSSKGVPTIIYATAGIPLWVIAPRKPPYPAKDDFVKLEILLGTSLHGTAMFRESQKEDYSK
jgi:hypothetical protein